MTIMPSRDFLSLSQQRALLRDRPWLRALLLVAGIVAIVVWQGSFRHAGEHLDRDYSVTYTVGGQQQPFVYFYHYLGLYPVTLTGVEKPAASEDAARNAIRDHGNNLRFGDLYDRMTILSYIPDVLLGGDPHAPRHNTAAWLGFTLALIALYVALWSARLELFAIALIALLGSNPFQLHEVYVQNNVFGWFITIGLLVTALNVPLIVNHRYYLTTGRWIRRYALFTAALSGAILGTFIQIHTACATTLLAVLAAYVFLSGVSMQRKAVMMSLVVVTFMAANASWQAYFDRVEAATAKVVAAAGGRGINDLSIGQNTHLFWQPIWAGLGDFDDKYGYLNWDRTADEYVLPILATQPDREPGISLRYKKAYTQILIDKLVHDVVNDPLWYGTIIAKRLHRILMENTPPRLAAGAAWVKLPGLAYLLAPFCVLLLICYLYRREFGMLLLLMFPFAMGGVPLAVTSVNGYHYFAVVHLFVYALLIAWIVEAGLRLYRSRASSTEPRGAAA